MLFGVLPEVVDGFNLLKLLTLYLTLHFLILLEEGLECGVVEASLLVGKHGERLQALCCTCHKGLLHLSIGHIKSEGVSLVLDKLVDDILVPHLVADLVLHGIAEVLSGTHLVHFRGLVHHFLEILNGKTFSVDFTHLLLAVV